MIVAPELNRLLFGMCCVIKTQHFVEVADKMKRVILIS